MYNNIPQFRGFVFLTGKQKFLKIFGSENILRNIPAKDHSREFYITSFMLAPTFRNNMPPLRSVSKDLRSTCC
jgi:hypothetical protein